MSVIVKHPLTKEIVLYTKGADSAVLSVLARKYKGKNYYSCTPDREILRFTPCEKFLSHPRYLTPVAPCVQVFFFNIGCIGHT